MMPSTDSQAVLLLCSHLGLPSGSQPAPLTLREWNALARQLDASALKRPGALLGLAAGEIQAALDLPEDQAARLAALLERGGTLAIELERLESLGIWALTRADESYPLRLRQRLKDSAPPVLFGSGEIGILGRPGLAVVGSRNVDEAARGVAESVGQACATNDWIVYSGSARGVDGIAMGAALESQGKAVGVLADSLEKAIRLPDTREPLARGQLTLLTPYAPKAGFSVGAAMGRNKLIYALADYALVVASEAKTGGTWAGATEALKARWVPVFVCNGPQAPEGNRLLLDKGGLSFPLPFPESSDRLPSWLADHAVKAAPASFF